MAITAGARVDAGVTSGNLASVTTGALATTAGDLVVVGISRQSATPAVTISDSVGGNTWTVVAGGSITQGANILDLYWSVLANAGAAHTFTATMNTGTSPYFAISARRFSGVTWPADPTDGNNGATGNSAALNSGSVTISGSDVVICSMQEADAQGHSGAGGYTVTVFSGAAGPYFADGYHLVAASEAAQGACTSGAWGIKAGAFTSGGIGPAQEAPIFSSGRLNNQFVGQMWK